MNGDHVPIVNRGLQSVGVGLATLMLIIGIERLTKRFWISGALALLVLAGQTALGAQGPVWLVFGVFASFFAIPMFVLLRLGALGFMFSMFTINILSSFPLTSQLGAWYAIPTRMVLILYSAIVFWGLRYGSGRRASA